MVTPSVGFIGLGVMGHRMFSNMTAHGGFTIASVWDPSRAVCNSVKQAYPDVRISESAEALVLDEKVGWSISRVLPRLTAGMHF
ncbi:MAG: hypothetical protein CM1200mP18_05930 [Gammaproteobacteria bacterium]|nr:MAG: hypothetical protein CM1200mP18_05930 [Gammaproteobacteria bacterium]